MEIVVLVSLHGGNNLFSFAFGKSTLECSVLLFTKIRLFFGEICEGHTRIFPLPAYCRQVALDGLANLAYEHMKQNISASNIVTELFSSFTAS